MSELKLGKLPFINKAKDLKYSNYKSASLPPIPESFGHQDKISNWGMLANDSVGDCVIAGAMHATMLWTTEGGKPATFTPANAISDYSSACGYIPGNPNSDQGCYVRNVLDYQRTTGVIDANGVRHKIGAYMALDLSNLPEILEAIYLFSVVKIGFIFPSSAMSQFYAGLPWTVVDGSTINGAHDVEIIGYDKDWLYVITWGKVQKMSFEFYQKYCDEAWVVLSNEMLNGSGLSPEGFNLAQLQTDLLALPNITPPPTLTSITISPAIINLQVGASQTIAVIATYSDGSTSNITNQVTFTTANTKIATVSNGVVQAISSGNTTVTVIYSGKTAQINIIVANTNYTLTTDNTSITSQINTPLNINVKLLNNSTPVSNQPIQSIYTGVIQGGEVVNTVNGIATFKIDTSKIGLTNASYIWFNATNGNKYNLAVTINVFDIPEPPKPKKLYHIQTLPIPSLKTDEIQKQIEKLHSLGYANVYSTISNQIVANSTEELAKANSDKLTASGIANIILYY